MTENSDPNTLYSITEGRHAGRRCKVTQFFFEAENRVASVLIGKDYSEKATVMAQHLRESGST